MRRYERNIPRPYGRGYEQAAGKIDTRRPLSSMDEKFYVINKEKLEPEKKQRDLSTLSSNCSMKTSTPLINVVIVSCVNTTPLGVPLVPLVYIIVQTSRGRGGTISNGSSFP